MKSKAGNPYGATKWLAVFAGLGFCAAAALVTTRHAQETLLGKQDPAAPAAQAAEVQLPPAEPAPEAPAPMESVPASLDTGRARPPAETEWQPVQFGPFTVDLPGSPEPDRKPGWFSRYPDIETLNAVSLPLEERHCHIRLSVIRHTKGTIAVGAAALVAKRSIEAEFSGITTVYPFEFRDLDARRVAGRRVDLDDLTRVDTFVVVRGSELILLSIVGLDQDPQRLAHQILRTMRY